MVSWDGNEGMDKKMEATIMGYYQREDKGSRRKLQDVPGFRGGFKFIEFKLHRDWLIVQRFELQGLGLAPFLRRHGECMMYRKEFSERCEILRVCCAYKQVSQTCWPVLTLNPKPVNPIP